MTEGQNNVGGKATISLVQQLVVTVLANGSCRSPENRGAG